MTCTTIDLDKYEFQNDPIGLRSYDCDESGLPADFQLIDAEIIDYGISEDELEETSTSSKEPTSYRTNNTEQKTSEHHSSISRSSKNKCLCIKVVDCDKYPLYYPKYKRQILKRKSLDAVKHARNIVKYLKNDVSELSTIIGIDHSSDITEKLKSKSQKNSVIKNKSSLKKTVMVRPVHIEKECTRIDKETQEKNSDSKMIPKVKSKTSATIVDLKKNKGLVGMKVRRISSAQAKSKEKCIVMQKSLKPGEEAKYHKNKSSCERSGKPVDKTFAILCNSDLDRTQLQDVSDKKVDRSISDSKSTQKIDTGQKAELKNSFDLKCSLKINSPRILMKIKKITPPREEKKSVDNLKNVEVEITPENKENDFADGVIANKNKDSSNISKDDLDKLTNYKPMPKSKKIALEYYKNMVTDQDNLQNTEDQLNQKSKHLKTMRAIESSPASIDKYSKNVKETVPKLTQNNKAALNESLLMTNKMSDKILKKNKITPNISKDMSKIIESTEKNVVKNDTSDQLNSFKNKPPQLFFMKNMQKANAGNKSDKQMRYDMLNMRQGQGTRIVVRPVNPENILTRFNKELYETDKRNYISKSTMGCKDASNLISSRPTTQLIHQRQEEGIIKQMDKEKHTEYNTSLKNTNNIENCKIHDRSNETKIQCTISSPYEPYKPSCGNHIPNILHNLPQGLSNFHRITGHISGDYENQKKRNNATKKIAQFTQRDPISKPQQNKSMQNLNRCILSESNINEFTSNAVQKDNHISHNSQTSIPIRPPITAPPNAILRPNIIKRPNNITKPHYGARFQRPPLLTLPVIRHRLKTPGPAIQPNGQIPYNVRPQAPFNQNLHRRCNQYQSSNFTCPPPMSVNVSKIPWNKVNQQTGNNYVTNSYIQQSVYNNFSHQSIPFAFEAPTNMPPGISNVQPNNNPWPYNVYNHFSFPPPQHPPPPPLHQPPPSLPSQSAFATSDNCSTIGENLTGPVKKIHIPNLVDLNFNIEVDSKEGIVKQENTNIDSNIPTNTKTISKASYENCTVSSADKTSPISTKTEMMQELEKAMMTVESPVKTELKRSYPNTAFYSTIAKSNQDNTNKHPSSLAADVSKSRPGPLSKRFKLNDPLTTPPRNSKLIPKMGYSPPILPIPTFQNILLEVQSDISHVGAKLEMPVRISEKKMNSFNVSTSGRNISHPSAKNIPQNKTMKKKKKIVTTEEENLKKISLDEYKKRSLKVTKEKKKVQPKQ